MKKYLKLLRVKHYIKNGLIGLPLIFALKLTQWKSLLAVGLGFIAFCLISSVVYIINDMKDIKKDRLHSTKCNRPLASGSVKIPVAVMIAVVFFLGAAGIMVYLGSVAAGIFLGLYLFLNIAYSFGLKNIPIIETVILSSGFVLRILFGGAIIGVSVSPWLLYTVISAACCMALGKRRGEILSETEETRKVNTLYSKNFLDKMMYVFFTLTIAFYALWTINIHQVNNYANKGIIWSVPIVMTVILRYCFLIEQTEGTKQKSDGDPTRVLLSDKWLLAFSFLFVAYILCIIYVPFGKIFN